MRTSLFGPLFGDKVAKQSTDAQAPSNTLMHELGALKAIVEMKDHSLDRLREEQRMFIAEIDSLRAVFIERTEEVLALRKEVGSLQQRIEALAPALCGVTTCNVRRSTSARSIEKRS